MPTNSLVSVIISAYNHERYIQETIQSIIQQTYQNIELIIIDDGSQDKTWKKILEMEKVCQQRFSRVVFQQQENHGTCYSANKLLNLANGEYVYFIASDDVAKPLAIEKEFDFLHNNPEYALAVGDNELIDSDSNVCFWDKKRNIVYDNKQAKYKTFADFIKADTKVKFNSKEFGHYIKLIHENHVPNGYLVRKSIFEKIGYFTPKAPLEDWWLMLQISKYAKMKYLNEILFSYRWHNSNTIKHKEKIKQMMKQNILYENEILENIDTSQVAEYSLKEILKIKKEGIVYRTFGIPNLITYEKSKKKNKKYRILKIFNIVVRGWYK